MDAAYLAAYEALYRSHWWWRAREALLLREISALSAETTLSTILDVGCGNGLFFPSLERFAETYGVEPVTEVLDPQGPYRARIHAGPLDDTYTPPRPVDLLLALDVIEHLTNPDAFLASAKRVLRPGGVCLVTVPALRLLWTAHDDLNGHVTRFSRSELVSLFGRHGFAIVHARYFFVLLAAAKLATRFVEAWRPITPQTPRVPPIFVNALARHACLLEQRLLGRHAPGFGSSLLLIATAPAARPNAP